MTEKFERTALGKARAGKASKAWLKAAAAADRTALATQALDAAFPGWIPRRGIDSRDVHLVDDINLARDLSPDGLLEPRLQEAWDAWVRAGELGILDEPLWRYLDHSFPQWLGKAGNKRTAALRLRAVQLAGFRIGAGRDPHVASKDAFERSLAGWLRRTRTKVNKGVLPERDQGIILGRIGRWVH